MSKQTLFLHIGDNGREYWFDSEPDPTYVRTLAVQIGDGVETTKTRVPRPPLGVAWRAVPNTTGDNVWQRPEGGVRKVHAGADAIRVLVPAEKWPTRDLRHPKWRR